MEYAIYKGDEFLFMGTEKEVLERLGWNRDSLLWICSDQPLKLSKEGGAGRLIGVRLNELFNEEEKIKYDIDDDSIDTKVYRAIRENKNITDVGVSRLLGVNIQTVYRAKRRLRKRGNVI